MMPKSRGSSPARSQGSVMTPRRSRPRSSRSMGSPTPTRGSKRLNNIENMSKEGGRSYFSVSPLSKTVLSDNTEIDVPRRQSWWRKVDNSRDMTEVLNTEKPANGAADVLEEFDVEVLSQEKKDYSMDIPESSGSESIASIVVPQRRLFTQKENVPQSKFGRVIDNRESLTKHNKTNFNDKSLDVGPKNLFARTSMRPKPVFPSALLNMSLDKTANKTKEPPAEVKGQQRNLFGNRLGTKRKNMFADFIVSESEDESIIPDIQPKLFAFQKQSEATGRSSTNSRGLREPSPTSSITTDIEMDDWKLLPSSTMVEHQLQADLTPGKRARLSKVSEAKESTKDSTKQSDQSVLKNKSKLLSPAKNQVDMSTSKNKSKTKINESMVTRKNTSINKSKSKKNKSKTENIATNFDEEPNEIDNSPTNVDGEVNEITFGKEKTRVINRTATLKNAELDESVQSKLNVQSDKFVSRNKSKLLSPAKNQDVSTAKDKTKGGDDNMASKNNTSLNKSKLNSSQLKNKSKTDIISTNIEEEANIIMENISTNINDGADEITLGKDRTKVINKTTSFRKEDHDESKKSSTQTKPNEKSQIDNIPEDEKEISSAKDKTRVINKTVTLRKNELDESSSKNSTQNKLNVEKSEVDNTSEDEKELSNAKDRTRVINKTVTLNRLSEFQNLEEPNEQQELVIQKNIETEIDQDEQMEENITLTYDDNDPEEQVNIEDKTLEPEKQDKGLNNDATLQIKSTEEYAKLGTNQILEGKDDEMDQDINMGEMKDKEGTQEQGVQADNRENNKSIVDRLTNKQDNFATPGKRAKLSTLSEDTITQQDKFEISKNKSKIVSPDKSMTANNINQNDSKANLSKQKYNDESKQRVEVEKQSDDYDRGKDTKTSEVENVQNEELQNEKLDEEMRDEVKENEQMKTENDLLNQEEDKDHEQNDIEKVPAVQDEVDNEIKQQVQRQNEQEEMEEDPLNNKVHSDIKQNEEDEQISKEIEDQQSEDEQNEQEDQQSDDEENVEDHVSQEVEDQQSDDEQNVEEDQVSEAEVEEDQQSDDEQNEEDNNISEEQNEEEGQSDNGQETDNEVNDELDQISQEVLYQESDDEKNEVDQVSQEEQSDNEQDEIEDLDQEVEAQSENEQDEEEQEISQEIEDQDQVSEEEQSDNEQEEMEEDLDQEVESQSKNDPDGEEMSEEIEEQGNDNEELDDGIEEQDNDTEEQGDIPNDDQSDQETNNPDDQNVIEGTDEDHDTTGRNRQKRRSSVEALRKRNSYSDHASSFTATGRNTSIRTTKSIAKNFSISLPRDSLGFSEDSSAQGSGWDSHRTTRKTLRQTFGRDFTPRKSLRALVMEKSAKRQTIINEANAKLKQANSTEIENDDYEMDFEENIENIDPVESDHEQSRIMRQEKLDRYLEKVKKENRERNQKIEQQVNTWFKTKPSSSVDMFNFRVPTKPAIRKMKAQTTPKAQKTKRSKPFSIPLEDLPSELVEDLKYKPPKRFRPSNASWITKRLYKFLETKLEPKYDYKARVRAEKLVETIYNFVKDIRRLQVAPAHSVAELKREMARLDVVTTHFDFYNFLNDYLPMEVKIKVVPDIINDIPLPRNGVFSAIIE